MSGILFLMDFGLTTNISILPELRRRKLWAIHSFMSLRQDSMFDSFAMVSGLAANADIFQRKGKKFWEKPFSCKRSLMFSVFLFGSQSQSRSLSGSV